MTRTAYIPPATVVVVDGESFVKLSDFQHALSLSSPQGPNEVFQPWMVYEFAKEARRAEKALKAADSFEI